MSKNGNGQDSDYSAPDEDHEDAFDDDDLDSLQPELPPSAADIRVAQVEHEQVMRE